MTDDNNIFVLPVPGPGDVLSSSMTYEITTLRDQFAMAALTGLLANPALEPTIKKHGAKWFDENAYAFADAMMEARK
jgi:hypothetical protein